MKQILLFLTITGLYSYTMSGQSTSQNFIKKTIPISPVSTEAALNSLGTSLKVESISYIDGLGRPLQDVLIKASPGANDLIQPYTYDQYGRQSMTFLPYADATNSGAYRSVFATDLSNFYTNQTMVAKTAYPYSEAVFDNSPLNVVRETSAPDADWQLGNGHTARVEHSFNPDPNEDVVMMWELQSNGDYATNDYYYPQNTLYTKKMTDPNGNYSIVYSDKNGKTICTKQFLETRYNNGNPYPYYLVTYMLYDDFDQLVVVIPPKAMELMDASQNYSVNGLTQDLVYRYVYDQRHRLIEKKAPGIGWQYIVYNQLDQPVLFRDANLQAQNKWSFIKYDVLGRPILSGLMDASGLFSYQTRALAQAALDATQTAFGELRGYDATYPTTGYTNVSLPNQNLEILTINYYDDYDFNNDGYADYSFNTSPVPCFSFNITALTSTYNYQVQSQDNTGNIDDELYTALINAGSPSTTAYTLISEAKALNLELDGIMSDNVSYSNALLSSQDPALMTDLKTSLEGQTASKITELNNKLDACLAAVGIRNFTVRPHLVNAKNYLTTIAASNGLSITTLTGAMTSCSPYINTPTKRTRGYLTGTKVKVLDATNPVQWENSVVFYDDDGQAIQSQSNDHMGGTDLINLVYDFAGNVIHSQQMHTSPSQPNIEVLNHMSFDKMGRLQRVDQKNNLDHPVILSKYNYNELSQLIDKKVHSLNDGNSFLQSMDFRYNIQGWLSSVNNIDLSSDMGANPTNGTNDDLDDLWGMELSYNTPVIGGTAQYNGNVSEKKWRSVDYVKRSYKYEYDKLDRLKSSAYAEYGNTLGWTLNAGKYDEKDITYDANGNIKTLKRYGFQSATSTFGLIDNLSYQYNGNLLTSVNDASPTHGMADFKDNGSTAGNGEYSYDGNGNVTGNLNKSISSIAYNHLNLPVQITFYNGNKIEYTYDAVGTRLRKKVTQGSTVTTKKYTGMFEYNTSNLLESMHTSEGRCVTTGSTPEFRYEYQYLDHTGNVMMAFSDMDFDNVVNPSTEVLQQNHYYSFGMRMEGTNAPFIGVENKYKFSGKELDDELGLNEYDFGARLYDPAIGRWGCMDPMADMAPHWTPFRYGFNNPVNVTDPTGMLEVSDQVGGGLDYKGDPKKKWVEEYDAKQGKIVGRWVDVVDDKSTESGNKTEGTGKGLGNRTEAKGRRGSSGNNNPATAGSGATTYIPGGSMNGMGNGGPAINYATEGSGSIGGYQGPGYDPLMLARNGTYYYPDKVPFGEKMEVLASWSTEVITGIFGGVMFEGVKSYFMPAVNILKYGCFVEGTLVWTEKGLQRIELIKEGDRVFAYDTESKKVVSKKVLTAYTREVSRLIKLEYGTEIIFTTSEHPFYVNNMWVEASKLKAGDFVFLHDESTLPVLKITVIDSAVKVYNFTVEDVHNYYVGKNKVLVHNNNPCAQVLKTVTSLVKTNSKMLELARETFKGNSLLNKEANNLVSQLIRGNMSPGIGTKIIGKEIFEARSRNGARVYFRNGANNIIEILGYSNKANQQTVIDLLLKIY